MYYINVLTNSMRSLYLNLDLLQQASLWFFVKVLFWLFKPYTCYSFRAVLLLTPTTNVFAYGVMRTKKTALRRDRSHKAKPCQYDNSTFIHESKYKGLDDWACDVWFQIKDGNWNEPTITKQAYNYEPAKDETKLSASTWQTFRRAKLWPLRLLSAQRLNLACT